MSVSELADLGAKAASGSALERDEAAAAARLLTCPGIAAATKEAFLLALGRKGETVDEVTAFARVFRDLARDPGLHTIAADAIDIVGTGGDKSGSFNLSTTAALIVAAAGVPVCKHGNRSITSKCGSADFVEALGVRLDADNSTLAAAMEQLNFAFFFAPAFHPAFKEIMPVRKAMAAAGHRSIFNILGPLINPARPAYQLLGVYSAAWVDPLAEVLHALNLKRGWVVHGSGRNRQGYDELTCAGDNTVHGFGEWVDMAAVWQPGEYGLERCPAAHLKGGDVARNLILLDELMNGSAPRGLADSVRFNAGAALWTTGRVPTIEEGMKLAGDVLTGGALRAWLEQLRLFYR